MDDLFKKALDYSFLLLKYRPRTVQEIKNRLKQKKFSKPVIEKVIGYLEERNLVNDEEFAFIYTRDKLQRGYGERLIRFQLKQLGAHPQIIDTALERVKHQINYKEIIKKLVNKLSSRNKKKQVILRYLIQRGFSYDDILKYSDLNNLNNSKE